MATISTIAVNFVARTRLFEKNVRRSRNSLYGFQKTAHKMRQTMRTLFVGGTMVYGLRRVVGEYAAFEKQMAMVSTMLDKQTMRYMPRYTAGLRRMAIEFGESTQTLSKGLYDILSASVAPEKAMQVLAVSTKAAKAGLTDTAVAADAITTILNSYGLAAEKATYVSDILFATVKRGKTTFGELAPNIGKVAALAAVAGMSLEDLGAMIATLTRAGLQTELAMTGIRSILKTFIAPARESRVAAEELGLQIDENTLSTLGYIGVLRKLSKANAEQLAAILPNMRGLVGLAAALKQVEGAAKDVEMTQRAAGSMQEAYNKMVDDMTEHSIEQAKEGLKSLATSFGMILAPAIRESSQAMSTFSLALMEGTKQYYALAKLRAESRARFYEILDLTTNIDELYSEEQHFANIAKRYRADAKIYEEALQLIVKAETNAATGIAGLAKRTEAAKIADTSGLETMIAKMRDLVGLSDSVFDSSSIIHFADNIDKTGAKVAELADQFRLALAMKKKAMSPDVLAGFERQLQQILNIEKLRPFTEKFSEIWDDLHRQVKNFGLGPLEIVIRQMNEMSRAASETGAGGLEEFNRNVAETMELAQRLQTLQMQTTLAEQGKQVWRETRTELERYNKRIEELGKLLEGKYIDKDTYSRAYKQAREELEKTAGVMKNIQDIGRAQDIGRSREFRPSLISPLGLVPDIEMTLSLKNKNQTSELQLHTRQNERQISLLERLADQQWQ